MAKGKNIQWDIVRIKWEAGLASNRKLAEEFGCDEKTIRNKAREEGWNRDLSRQIRKAAQEEVIRRQVRKEFAPAEVVAEGEDRIDRDGVFIGEAAEICANTSEKHLDLAKRVIKICEGAMDALEILQKGEKPIFSPFVGKNEGFGTVLTAIVKALDTAITWERVALNLDETQATETKPRVIVDT